MHNSKSIIQIQNSEQYFNQKICSYLSINTLEVYFLFLSKMQMSFEYGPSNKNKTTLIYNGCEYMKKQRTKTTVHWICQYVKHFGCKATIITCGDTIIEFRKNTAFDMFPERQKPEKLWPLWRPRYIQAILARLLGAVRGN